jgi:hypothetical protein
MKNKRRYETYIDRNVILLWLLVDHVVRHRELWRVVVSEMVV